MVTIKGIRIQSITLNFAEDGEDKMTCNYALISSADKILSRDTIGGYNGMKMQPSPGTQKALDTFIDAYKADVNALLGLDAD